MATREEKIAQLTDQQALAIVNSIVGEFTPDDIPERTDQQIQALEAFLSKEGFIIDVSLVTQADEATAAIAARQILTTLGAVEEVQPSLDEWLDKPPTQETAAPIPLILAVPIIITGCIILLYIVGHTHIERSSDGKWTISYNKPGETSPMDEHIKNGIIQPMRTMLGIYKLPDNTGEPDKPGGIETK